MSHIFQLQEQGASWACGAGGSCAGQTYCGGTGWFCAGRKAGAEKGLVRGEAASGMSILESYRSLGLM